MSNLLNAVDQIKSWANKNRAIIVLADELERIGSLEQAALEGERKLASVRLEIEKESSKLESFKSEAESAKASVNSYLAGVQDKAKAASEAADRVVSDAESKAASIVSAAEDRAKAILSDASAGAKRVASEVDALCVALVDAQNRTESARKEYQDYVEKLNKAKAEAKSLMAGIA